MPKPAEKDTLAAACRRLSVVGKSAASGLLTALVVATAAAQDKDTDTIGADTSSGKVSLESDFNFGLVSSSHFRQRNNTGDVDAYDLGSRDVLSYQVHEGVLVRFGLEMERYNFGMARSLQLPSKLQETTLVIGADLQLGDAWIMRLEVQPGFYGAGTQLGGQNFDAPVVLGASYFVSSDLQLVAGLSIDAQRKYPVLPGLGFRYKCNADWVIDAILPTPRIEYNFNKSLLFYVGGDVQGSSYRTDADFGNVHGDPRLNNAWVDYAQIRVGVGTSWKIRPELTLEFEAGFVPVQEFDFHRADLRASATDTPPYGGLVLKAAF